MVERYFLIVYFAGSNPACSNLQKILIGGKIVEVKGNGKVVGTFVDFADELDFL